MNGKKNLNTEWRRDHSAKLKRHHRRRAGLGGERDLQWRTAAGLLLLAGILSLVAAGDHRDPAGRIDGVGRAYYDVLVEETRRATMETQEPSGTALDQPWERVTASVTERASATSSDVGLHLAPSDAGNRSLTFGRLLDQAESLIRRYPWPTVFLGLAAGFLLARRVR